MAAALALACSHPEPFQNGELGSDTTFDAGPLLTLNLGADVRPGWLPDGSGLVYSFEDLGDPLLDRCLAVLPRSGGSRRDLPCARTFLSADSVDAFLVPAPGPGGQMLFVREVSVDGLITPLRGALQLSTIERPDSARTLLTYPYTAPNGKLHQGIDQIRWLSPTRALYLATTVAYPRPCGTCEADTVRTGIELVEVDFSGATAVIQPIANTDGASSVDIGASGDDVYFSRNGDTQVYHLVRSTGIVTPIHDFGAQGIARDVIVSGNQLIALVGGGVSYVVDPSLGPTQLDLGGDVWVANLVTGNQVRHGILDLRWFRRPRMSPQGTVVVAESFQLTLVTCGPLCVDTLISRNSDLFLLTIPSDTP